jgi:hypothetical protein
MNSCEKCIGQSWNFAVILNERLLETLFHQSASISCLSVVDSGSKFDHAALLLLDQYVSCILEPHFENIPARSSCIWCCHTRFPVAMCLLDFMARPHAGIKD